MPRIPLLLLLTVLLGGCATLPEAPRAGDALPARMELAQTPFFPQQAYQCGPAALATVLHVAGVPRSPEELTPQVYLPERRGSLQVDMLGGIRRQGVAAVRLAPTLEALFKEVAAGHPVVVFQNLGLRAAPVWHYAVLIGYDLERGTVVLRSGEQARLEMPLRTFQRTWARAGNWAVLAQDAGQPPVTADEARWLQAALALEQAGQGVAAERAYAAAARRWPHSEPAWLGVGNVRHARGDWLGAARAFREASAALPESAAARHNLAHVLLDLGALDEAHDAARRAVALGGPFAPASARVLARVEQARARAGR